PPPRGEEPAPKRLRTSEPFHPSGCAPTMETPLGSHGTAVPFPPPGARLDSRFRVRRIVRACSRECAPAMISDYASAPAAAGQGLDDGWSDELAAAHHALSPVDLAFREEARRSPELLDRATFQAMEPDGDLVDRPVQPWPTFLGAAARATLAAA